MSRCARRGCATSGGVCHGRTGLGRSHWRRDWLATLLLALVLLASLGGSVLPPNRTTAQPFPCTPLEALSSQPADHAPIALTGPRSIAVVVGLNEPRPRAGQVVAPSAPSLVSGGSGPWAGLTTVVPRPPLLTARGLLDVRAPPAALL